MLRLTNGEIVEADLMVGAIGELAHANIELSARLDRMERDVARRRAPSTPLVDAEAEVARILATYNNR
jgi:hypothetical protein